MSLSAVPRFDDAGGRVADETQVVYRNLPCFVQVEKQEENLQYQRQELLGDFQVVTYINPGIRNGDILIFQGGRVLNVVGITNDLELSPSTTSTSPSERPDRAGTRRRRGRPGERLTCSPGRPRFRARSPCPAPTLRHPSA